MSAVRVSLADRERPNALGISLGVETVGRPALSAAILTAKEKSPNGGRHRANSLEAEELTSHKTKRQLASLSAKVQAYEDVIRKLSNRFGVSDEQLVNIALAVVGGLPCHR
jgi:hypothetical protein